MNFQNLINRTIMLLSDHLQDSPVDQGHDINHALIVFKHSQSIIQHEPNLTDTQKLAIYLASLLHDADDSKFFPESNDYQYARKILQQLKLDSDIKDLVIYMISLVSCSKNKNNKVDPNWLLIPRWADRLEAIGEIGVVRAYLYSISNKHPLFIEETSRNSNLSAVVTKERFENFEGPSLSFIDHFYDKLLHLKNMNTDNQYIKMEVERRHQVMSDFCLDFCKTGKINLDKINKWAREFNYCLII